jgi:hypothetical protein
LREIAGLFTRACDNNALAGQRLVPGRIRFHAHNLLKLAHSAMKEEGTVRSIYLLGARLNIKKTAKINMRGNKMCQDNLTRSHHSGPVK